MDHGFNHPWPDDAFFWVLGQWLKNSFLYRRAFPALPQLIYHPDPNLILLEEGPTFSVVPELKPYSSERQWWALSDSLAHTYKIAIRQWQRDLGVVKTWFPNLEALCKAYFAEAVQKRQYCKVRTTPSCSLPSAKSRATVTTSSLKGSAYPTQLKRGGLNEPKTR